MTRAGVIDDNFRVRDLSFEVRFDFRDGLALCGRASVRLNNTSPHLGPLLMAIQVIVGLLHSKIIRWHFTPLDLMAPASWALGTKKMYRRLHYLS